MDHRGGDTAWATGSLDATGSPWAAGPAEQPTGQTSRLARPADLSRGAGLQPAQQCAGSEAGAALGEVVALGVVGSLVLWMEELRKLVARRRGRRGGATRPSDA